MGTFVHPTFEVQYSRCAGPVCNCQVSLQLLRYMCSCPFCFVCCVVDLFEVACPDNYKFSLHLFVICFILVCRVQWTNGKGEMFLYTSTLLFVSWFIMCTIKKKKNYPINNNSIND